MSAGEEKRKSAVRARIARVRRHLNLGVAVRAAVGPVWVSSTSFVVWRLFVHRGTVVVGVACLLAAAGAVALLSARRRWSDTQASVIADRSSGAGGMLLTRLELPVGEWEFSLNQQLKRVTLPPLEVRRQVALLVVALAFVIAGLLVPHADPIGAAPNAAAASRVEQLEEKLAAIAREEPAPDAANAELERLKGELAEAAFDATDWEATDTLDAQLDKQAAEAASELARAESAAQKLSDAMAQAQSEEGTRREREELEKALMDLSDGQAQSGDEAMKQALAQDGPSGQEGQNGQQGQGENGQRGQKSADVADLRRALAQRREQLAKSFGPSGQQQSQSGTNPRSRAGKGEGEGQGSREGANNGEGHASRQVKQGEGVARGGSASELVFGDEAEMNPERLRLDALPQGHGGDGEELMGLRAANPRATNSARDSSVQGTSAAGQQAAGYDEGAMRPRNRALVQRYFDSK